MGELVELGHHLVGADRGRGGDEIESALACASPAGAAGCTISFSTVPSLENLASSAFRLPPAPGSALRSTGVRAWPISLLRSWTARVTRSRICRSALSNWL